MNLETRKYNLINWITGVNNEDMIEYLELLRISESGTFQDLPDEIKIGLNKSLKQADNGELISQENVYQEIKKIYL